MIKEMKRPFNYKSIGNIMRSFRKVNYEERLLNTICRLDLFFSERRFSSQKEIAKKEISDLLGQDIFKHSVKDGMINIFDIEPSINQLGEIDNILFNNFPYLTADNFYMKDYLYMFFHPDHNRLYMTSCERACENKKLVLKLVKRADICDNSSGSFFKFLLKSEYKINVDKTKSKPKLISIIDEMNDEHELEDLYYSIESAYRWYSNEDIR